MYPKTTKAGLATALTLGLCVGTGVTGASAGTVSAGTTLTTESSSVSAPSDLPPETYAQLSLEPAEVTLPAGGQVKTRAYGSWLSTEPVWARGTFHLGEVPQGITARIVRDKNDDTNAATITIFHTGTTTTKVLFIPVTVSFGRDTATKMLKVNVPLGNGNDNLPIPAPDNGTYIDEVGDDSRGRIDATSVAKAGVTSEVGSGNRLTLGIKAQHPCLEAVGITVVTPDGRRHTLKRAANNPTRCTAWSGERTGNYRVRMKTDGEWKLELSSTSTDVGQLQAFRVTLDTQ